MASPRRPRPRWPGAATDGVLAEEAVYAEHGLVATPAGLSDEEAATLPCAAVTAWNALFVGGAQAGQTALLLGTGGVSIWGCSWQGRRPAGHRHLVQQPQAGTGARTGRDVLINYRETPEWQVEALRQTDGDGAHVVVEVGGQGTLERSVAAVRMGGTVSMIGGVSGFGATPVLALIGGAKRLEGIFVGSRKMLEDLAVSFRSPASSPRSTGSLASTRRRSPSRTWRPAAISARW